MKITFWKNISKVLRINKHSIVNKPCLPEDNTQFNLEDILENMKTIFQPRDYDWMEYPITKKNRLSAYPITEPHNEDIHNFALLTKQAYKELLILKDYYPELYEEYLYMLQIINDMQCPVVHDIKQIMNAMKSRMTDALNQKTSKYPRYIK